PAAPPVAGARPTPTAPDLPPPPAAPAQPVQHAQAEPDFPLPPPAPAPGSPGAPEAPGTHDAPPAPAPGEDPRSLDDAPAPGGDRRPRCVACGTGTVDRAGHCEHCGHVQPRERDHMERTAEGVAAVSDRGLRHHRNEDSFAVATGALPDGSPAVVAVVCDGVSSATRPDEASATAAETACASALDALPRGVPARQAVHDALVAAAEAVSAMATEEETQDPTRNAPACTIVCAVVAGDLLTVGWIGDSRAYWVPDDRSAQPARLTEDDSWAAQMVAAGLMEEAEAYADPRAHAITGWLGADAYEIDPHTAAFAPDRPGVVVVCTDGLWNYAESAEEMAAVVAPDARTDPLRCARRLVGHALDGGGHDNVTVAVVPFPAPSGPAPSDPTASD
ncbi:PP2C family serine/threonine-protein phosphatase, partial [Streptomyces macrosporus]|uniref:PP2C family protein-serine/threonine phosphatase n=1 Tax=Streptomyces macrosporus TaxID=44032 RepID=UPI0031CE753F